MKKIMLVALVLAVVLSGCQTVPQENQDKIIRAINGTELVFGMGLSFAEMKGADPIKVAQIRLAGTVAFGLAREVVNFNDAEGLPDVIARLRIVTDDVLLLSESVGVSPAIISDIRMQADRLFESLAIWLK